jgi:peroxiredoxin
MNQYLILALAFAWLALLVGSWIGWQLLRQNGRLLLRLDEIEKRLEDMEFGAPDPSGLAVGSVAPAFELPNLEGKQTALADFQGQSVLVIFFNPACGYCLELAPRLASIHRPAPRGGEKAFTVLLISTGDSETNGKLFKENQLTYPVLLQKEMEVAIAYKADGTPSGYLISPEGMIASGLAIGADALLGLAAGKAENGKQETEIDQRNARPHPRGEGEAQDRVNRFNNHSLARSRIKRDGLKAGTPAPDFRLPRLDGRGELGLEDLRGRRVLLVFSNPHCGPCEALAPQLEKFHRAHPDLEVVLISKGEPGENRAKVKQHSLTYPIVLQQQWEISRRYAMFATPVAYLIDEAGVIIHDVAVGLDAIRALMVESVHCAKEAKEAALGIL